MSASYIVKIEGVRGESKKRNEEGVIEINSFAFGVTNQGSGVSDKHKRRHYTDVHIKKYVDKSSTNIMNLLRRNAMIEKVSIIARKATGTGDYLEFLKIKLHDAYISTYNISGDKDSDGPDDMPLPQDEFTVNFRKIEVEYSAQDNKGQGEGATTFMDELNLNA